MPNTIQPRIEMYFFYAGFCPPVQTVLFTVKSMQQTFAWFGITYFIYLLYMNCRLYILFLRLLYQNERSLLLFLKRKNPHHNTFKKLM